MPNYSLQVDNSRNYDPTLRNTLQAYADAQEQDMRTAEAAYGEMSAKANMLEKLANDVKGKDSVAYQNYMNYANTLRQQTDLLATRGLNPSIWKNIIQAKNDYSRIIHPIEEAYQAREKEAQRQAEYMKQHPGAVFERNAYNMGIDQWMKNPHYTAQVIDKETIANRAKERFAALKTQLMEFVSQNGGLDAIMTKNPDAVKRWFKTKAPWLYESMYKTGANPEDVKKLLAGDPEMENSMLQGIVNDTVRMSGIDSWNTDYDHYTAEQNAQNRQNLFDQIYTSVRGESPNAIGETKFDKYTDNTSASLMMEKMRLAEQKREFDEKMNEARRKAAKTAAEQKIKNANMIRISAVWNDNKGGERKEEIKEAISTIVSNGLNNAIKSNTSWKDLQSAIEKLSDKGVKFDNKKGANNTIFYEELNKLLEKNNVEKLNKNKTEYDKDLRELARLQSQLTNISGGAAGQSSMKNIQEGIERVQKRLQSYRNNNAVNDYNSDESINDHNQKYINDAYIKNGYTKDKDGNWSKMGQKSNDDFVTNMLNFRAGVHEVDLGATVIDDNVSKDLATRMWSAESGYNILGGGTFGLLDSGAELPKENKWFSKDSDDFKKYLNLARTGSKYQQILLRYNTTTHKVEPYVCYWDNSKDAVQDKNPEIAFPINSRIFDVDTSYTDENGNIHYESVPIQMYLDNQTQMMNDIILNEESTPEEREAAYKALRTNNMEVFNGINIARTMISTEARYGRPSSEGPNLEEQAAIQGNINFSDNNSD